LLTFRMWHLLRLLDFDIGFPEAFRVNLASIALGLMLPGLVGIDAIRATYFCMRTEDRKVDAFTSIMCDRIIGIYALILLASLAAGLGWLAGLESIHVGFVLVSTGTLAMVSIALTLLASKRLQEFPPLAFFFRRLPKLFQGIITAIQQFIGYKKNLLLLLLVSLISQSITVGSFVIVGLIIHDNLPMLAHFIINPIALFLNAVPLTPGGLGITESAFAYLYQTAQSDNGAIISLLGRINQYCVYIGLGLPALFLLKWKPNENQSQH
jgi:uncharacterized protein (TIRG00374 family)